MLSIILQQILYYNGKYWNKPGFSEYQNNFSAKKNTFEFWAVWKTCSNLSEFTLSNIYDGTISTKIFIIDVWQGSKYASISLWSYNTKLINNTNYNTNTNSVLFICDLQ